MVRAILVRQTGDPDVLRPEQLELAAPRAGEVRIRHQAIGLNYVDTYYRSGLYPLPELPSGLGMEGAGVVEEVGPGVAEVAVGDSVVYASAPLGAYAEARLMPAARVVKLPAGIKPDVAAAAMLKGLTVEYLVRKLYRVERGETVLWHAAAGGVGLIACQWLAHLGVRTIGTVGSEEKAALAREHGCSHTIVYTREDFAARVRELTDGRGVPVVFDSVGRTTLAGSLDCLAPRGLFVSFGNASGKPDPLDLGLLTAKGSLFVTRPTLAHYTATREELLSSAAALFDVIQCGAVRIAASQTWPLEAAAEAHRAMESRTTTGSCLLIP
ncbi:MAG: quinone oxidoreductase [Polyangiaceae bacterium]|nr:quinone oxidoreductase [Polyangiaceae bacterium]